MVFGSSKIFRKKKRFGRKRFGRRRPMRRMRRRRMRSNYTTEE